MSEAGAAENMSVGGSPRSRAVRDSRRNLGASRTSFASNSSPFGLTELLWVTIFALTSGTSCFVPLTPCVPGPSLLIVGPTQVVFLPSGDTFRLLFYCRWVVHSGLFVLDCFVYLSESGSVQSSSLFGTIAGLLQRLLEGEGW